MVGKLNFHAPIGLLLDVEVRLTGQDNTSFTVALSVDLSPATGFDVSDASYPATAVSSSPAETSAVSPHLRACSEPPGKIKNSINNNNNNNNDNNYYTNSSIYGNNDYYNSRGVDGSKSSVDNVYMKVSTCELQCVPHFLPNILQYYIMLVLSAVLQLDCLAKR